MAADYSPGFYKTNLRAITLREFIRARGIGKVLLYVKSFWFKPRQNGYWMPRLLADTECSPHELSPRFWEAANFSRDSLQRLGFTEFSLARIKPHQNLSPTLVENGVIRYLHSNRSHLASISFLHAHVPDSTKVHPGKVTVHFSAAFAHRLVSYADNKSPLVDPAPGVEIFRVPNASPQFLYQHFTNYLDRTAEKPLTFPDDESLRRYIDERQISTFRHGVDRRIFVRMTDAEIEKFRRNMPPSVNSRP